VIQWSEEDVAAWLEKAGFQETTIELLCKKHKLDGRSLLTLNEDDLRKKPLSLPCLFRLCTHVPYLRERKKIFDPPSKVDESIISEFWTN